MIVYKLACKNDHSFEAWFRDSGTCDAQIEAGQVICPACGSTTIAKALMAPSIVKGRGKAGRNKAEETAPAVEPVEVLPPRQVTNDREAALRAEIFKAIGALRQHVESSCDYVGERFPEEARRIHYGEVERRDIYGEASSDEARKLRDEGIEVYGIPWLPRHDS
jgi:hypothetical protein